MTRAAGISGKTNHSGRKTLVQKLQDSGVPPNQIIQITGHKNVQSVNNYSSLREKQMESISRILSSTTKAATNVAQTENNLTAQHLVEHRIASTSTTSSTLDVNSFNENPGGGGTPRNSWWGCAARVFKSRPYFRPTHAIFHTRFQT